MEKVVEFNLINSLPVPVDTTPIYEILDFKERRKDELLKLRTHLDNIYTDIINAEEMQKEYQKESQKFQQIYMISIDFLENIELKLGLIH